MKKLKKLKWVLISASFQAIFLFITVDGNSQNFSLTGSLGVSNYHGDLANSNTPNFKPDYSLGATYDLSNRFRLRFNASSLSVQGDDSKSNYSFIRTRGLNFKSKIQEAALLGEFDLIDNSFNSIIPYIFLGGSFYHFDPYALTQTPSEKTLNLHYLGTEGQYLPNGKYANRQYSRNQFNIQFGAGLRFEISQTVSIGAEANFRKLFTDYLDDVSANNYVTREEWKIGIDYARTVLKDEALANRLTTARDYAWRYMDSKGNLLLQDDQNSLWPRGNPSKNDDYYSFQIRLNIRLNSGSSSAFYSPRNPFGTKQLKCAKGVY